MMHGPLLTAASVDLDKNLSLLGGYGFSLPNSDTFPEIDLGGGNTLRGANANNKLRFEFGPHAQENLILVDPESACMGRVMILGSKNLVILRGSYNGRQPIELHMFSNHGVFFFGLNATSNTATFEVSGDNRSIIVGEDCMFSAHIDVMTDDRHAIVDDLTGEHINRPESILFEPHCWIGLHATVLKGVTAGFGSVIASRSLVTTLVPEMTVVGGAPARILRKNALWVRHHTPNPSAIEEVRRSYEVFRASRQA